MKPAVLFVAGAHTEIGKTHVACALIRAARDLRLKVEALKPVVSGFDSEDWAASDPGRLLAAAGAPLTVDNLDRISPWRFAAPLAPPLAALREGRALPYAEIHVHLRAALADCRADLLVVEGVGGLMSPIADGATSLDLMRAAGGASVVVAGCYLGAVSHALTAVEVLVRTGRPPLAVVVSERGSADDLPLADTLRLLEDHLATTPVVAAPHGDAMWAARLLPDLLARARVP
ncbi:MAG: dethiobiotin synthase [Caulobacteraceae bacterium]|nr:dethiobiotin synthase [Caulobacteraceae bacterium]